MTDSSLETPPSPPTHRLLGTQGQGDQARTGREREREISRYSLGGGAEEERQEGRLGGAKGREEERQVQGKEIKDRGGRSGRGGRQWETEEEQTSVRDSVSGAGLCGRRGVGKNKEQREQRGQE